MRSEMMSGMDEWRLLLRIIVLFTPIYLFRYHLQAVAAFSPQQVRSFHGITKQFASTETIGNSTSTSFTLPRFSSQEYPKYLSLLHTIHVEHVLTDEQASRCLDMARTYARETGRWEKPDSARHSTYATCDFPVEDCSSLEKYLEEVGFHRHMWSLLADRYGVEEGDMEYLDLFCVNYCAKSASKHDTMDRLEAHRDGSLLSFTVLLSPPDQFEGGGTFFEALKDCSEDDVLFPGGVVRPTRAGDACLHSGKILHGADVVTSGERTVLVGFVDVGQWRQRPGVQAAACRDWGRMDVAKNRAKRQVEKTRKSGLGGWHFDNTKWFPEGASLLACGFCPAFEAVERRAEESFQRRTRLETEDILLRSILLERDEESSLTFYGGDISVIEKE